MVPGVELNSTFVTRNILVLWCHWCWYIAAVVVVVCYCVDGDGLNWVEPSRRLVNKKCWTHSNKKANKSGRKVFLVLMVCSRVAKPCKSHITFGIFTHSLTLFMCIYILHGKHSIPIESSRVFVQSLGRKVYVSFDK